MDKIEDLLLKTSRTFALSIPLLDAPLRQQIALAYLLFRIADTFEDAETWAPEKRIEALERFEKMLQEQADDQAWKEATKAWSSQQPSEHEGYIELIEEIPFVMQTFFTQVSPEAQQVISHHTIRTTQGMVRFLTQMDHEGSLRLDTLQELRDYCYVVAGIVGDLLSELFLLEETSLNALDAEEKAGWLKQGVAFGEGLQLVNILKDASDDAQYGRVYLPASVPREELFQLAKQDLQDATEYTHLLQQKGASHGTLAFVAMPLLIARETLEALYQHGPGAKIGRERVTTLFQEMQEALESGTPVC
ncbi:MAG: squalene/phytoene synthase family protein [Myxococcales bacterium]|nr:squalene/phytoene synthase family protein [Myxococcales bacterium]